MQLELDKKVRENEEATRKFRKSKMAAQDHQHKCYVACQKKEYKFNKEKAKLVRMDKFYAKHNIAFKISGAKGERTNSIAI